MNYGLQGCIQSDHECRSGFSRGRHLVDPHVSKRWERMRSTSATLKEIYDIATSFGIEYHPLFGLFAGLRFLRPEPAMEWP